MSVKVAKKIQRNELSDDKKGPQKIRILLRRALKRNSKKKMRKKKRILTGKKKKTLLNNCSVKNIH